MPPFSKVVGCLAMLLAGLTVGGPVSAQTRPLTLERTEHWLMRSTASDRTYGIYLLRPAAPAPAGGYPILYTLDADVSMGMYADTLALLERAGRIPPVVLVAIGVPPEADLGTWRARMDTDRSYDYTPKAPATQVIDSPPHGGADDLLTFIVDELKPRVERMVKVDRSRQALSGHSYGGLFTLNALLTRPDSFQTFLASSPSIWFGQRYIISRQAGFADRLHTHPRVMIMAGRDEQPFPGNQSRLIASPSYFTMLAERRMVDNSDEFAAWLRGRGVAVEHRIAPDATHDTAKVINLTYALDFAFGR